MHHLSHKPDSGHVLKRIHAGRQALLGSMHNRLIRRAHLVDVHDERRKERINATGHVSITRAWNQTDNLHEGGGKAEFVMVSQSLDYGSDHASSLVRDVL